MKEKINRISGWGWVGIGIMSIVFSAAITYLMSVLWDSYTIEPWKNAADVATENALSIFSDGSSSNESFLSKRLSALLGILLYMIIGPGLLILFGVQSEQESSDDTYSRPFIGFIVGMILVFAGIFSFGVQSAIHTYINQHSKKNAVESAAKDKLRINMSHLATESYEYLVLPKEQGGGGGSFDGLEITDLPSYGELEYGTYQFSDLESDTLLRIVGSAVPDHPDARAASDKIELIVQVMPEDIIKWE